VQPLFPTAFHRLVHGQSDALRLLLDLEAQYASAVADLVAARDRAVGKLQARQAAEMDAAAAQDPRTVHALVHRHMEVRAMPAAQHGGSGRARPG